MSEMREIQETIKTRQDKMGGEAQALCRVMEWDGMG